MAAWSLWLAAVSVASLSLLAVFGPTEAAASLTPAARLSRVLYLAQPLLITTVAVLIATRRPDNSVGWLMLIGGLFMAIQGFAQLVPSMAEADSSTQLRAAWVSNWTWAPGETALEIALVLFPTGRSPGRRWQAVLVSMAGLGGLLTLVAALVPGPLDSVPRFDNPLGIGNGGPLVDELRSAVGIASSAMLVVPAVALMTRFRAARGDERQQLKWLAYAVGIGAGVSLINALGVLGELGDAASNLALGCVPLAVGLAMLRYRLYEIDLLINRTLVYGGLSVAIAAVYVLVVGYVDAALPSGGTPTDAFLPSLVLTSSIALLFQPLRQWVQRGVNRLLYGQRDEPYTAISQLGKRLESSIAPGAGLSVIVQAVRDSLKLPYAAVELSDGDGYPTIATAASGTPVADPLSLPLIYQQARLGELRVSPRAPGEKLGTADRRLLDDLVRQAGVVAHAVRLTAELQYSRERLVTAREEERRRLRRDLHDGLGPTLAALALKLETARNRLGRNPDASQLLTELATQAQSAVSDIRRLVHGLRPPALDDLGLVEALRQQGEQHAGGGGPQVRVEYAGDLSALPAAVEVAAYRIAAEALTNVVRHARARCCVIHLAATAAGLAVEIEDDGRGLDPARTSGVGMLSMRERAEELGGSVSIESAPGTGTRVRAMLPIAQSVGA